MSISYIFLLAALLILAHSQSTRPVKCDPPETQIQKLICPPYTPPPTSIIKLQGCQKMLDSQKCQICQKDFVLVPENGTCLSKKVINDIETEALDIGEPIIDITDELETRFGPSARSVHDFNLRNHPELRSYSLIRGISKPAILGIYVTLYYTNNSQQTQVMIIAFTECSGRINELFYSGEEAPNFKDPLLIFEDYSQQFSEIELFQILKIANLQLPIFHIYIRNGNDIFYLVYYLNQESFRERIQSNLIDVFRPYVARKLATISSNFNLAAATATQLSDRTVLFREKNSSISTELFGCNIIVNNIITAKPIADTFYSVFEKAKAVPQSLISSLPEYKDIIQNQQNSNYRVLFAVKNEAKKTQISLQVQLVDSGQESYFSKYIIDGVPITEDLFQADQEIKFDPPDADNKFSYKLENVYCEVFREDGFLCNKCKDGYTLTGNGFCVDGKCLEFLRDICIFCRDGYRIAGSTCLEEVNNCVSYNTLNYKCKECQTGYYLNESYFCLQIPIPDCKIYSSRQGCEECFDGFTLADGFCISQREFCLEFSGNECVLCVMDYYPKNGKCVPSPCPRGYLIKPNEQCAKIPDKCNNYDVNKYECVSCEEGYHLLKQECLPDIKNCVKYDQQNRCQKCENRFYVTGNICEPVSELCATYNETNGWCLTCNDGYSLSEATGRCVSLGCNKGYYLSPEGFCKKIPSYCSNFNAQSQTCLVCDLPAQLINGQCLLSECASEQAKKCILFSPEKFCVECIPGYYLSRSSNACLKANPLCLANSKTSNTCTICHPGFRLTSGACISTGITCSITGKDGICVKCPNRTFLYEGLCAPVSDNCKTWDVSTGLCTSCYSGYLRFGICLQGTDICG